MTLLNVTPLQTDVQMCDMLVWLCANVASTSVAYHSMILQDLNLSDHLTKLVSADKICTYNVKTLLHCLHGVSVKTLREEKFCLTLEEAYMVYFALKKCLD